MEKGKKKRRRSKPTAQGERIKQLGADILSAVIAGLILMGLEKLLK